jgi:hypothetical protein
LAGEIRGLTAQPTGLASGPGTELPSQSGPGHDPRRRPTSPGAWPGSMDLSLFVGAPSAVSPIAGWTLVPMHGDRNAPDRPRCPCSPTVRQPNRQNARAATRRATGLCHPPVARPSLWPSTLERSLSCCVSPVQARGGSAPLAGPLGVRGRGASGCEDNDRRYDLYQGPGRAKGIRTRGRRGGAWSPTRGRSGRTSLATPSTYLLPGSCGPRHRSPPLPGVFTKCSCRSAGIRRHYGISPVRLVGGPRPPLGAPTNRRAGHRPWTELVREFQPGPGHGPGGETTASGVLARSEVDAVPGPRQPGRRPSQRP